MRKQPVVRALAAAVALGCLWCPGAARAAASLKADYRFDDSLTSSVGTAPALTQVGTCPTPGSYATDDVFGTQDRVLSFDEGCGLELAASGQTAADTYSMVLQFRFTSVDGYRRVFDPVSGFNPDWGFYVRDGDLVLYNIGQVFGGTGHAIEPGKYTQVVVTRDGSTGDMLWYVNGVQQWEPTFDYLGAQVMGPAQTPRFFIDDGSENSAGAVARLRAYDGVLTPEEVAALDGTPAPDVSVTKTDDVDPALVGGKLGYTLEVKNAGVPSKDVVVTDELPAGVDFVSASSGCSQAAGKVTCDAGTVSQGAPKTFKIVVRPTATNAALANTATVTSSTTDLDPSNNSSTATTAVIQPADLSVTTLHPAGQSRVGEQLTFSLKVANAGPATAESVVLSDDLSADLDLISAPPGCVATGGTVTCALGTMAAGASATRELVVRPTAPDPVLLNTATVRSETGEVNMSNNFSTTFTDVRPALPAPTTGGGPGAKTPAAPPKTNVINGTPGNDVINGTPGKDVINCGAGDDVVNAGAGDDVINCGPGDDTVNAGAGNDIVHGNSGDDVINGEDGNDRLFGDTDRDRISGGAGKDRIFGGAGDDNLSGNDSADRIQGGSGNDGLSGGSGRDRLKGNSGNERLFGGSGRDRLFGGSGRDRLSGGPGKDRETQ